MAQKTSEASAKAGPDVLLGGERRTFTEILLHPQAGKPGRVLALHWFRADELQEMAS